MGAGARLGEATTPGSLGWKRAHNPLLREHFTHVHVKTNVFRPQGVSERGAPSCSSPSGGARAVTRRLPTGQAARCLWILVNFVEVERELFPADSFLRGIKLPVGEDGSRYTSSSCLLFNTAPARLHIHNTHTLI